MSPYVSGYVQSIFLHNAHDLWRYRDLMIMKTTLHVKTCAHIRIVCLYSPYPRQSAWTGVRRWNSG